MKTIEEKEIRFMFGDSWTVVEKWDDSRSFKDGIHNLQGKWCDEKTGDIVSVGSKAVDIVGVRGGDIYLIEVKDFRGYAIETRKRQLDELPLAIGCKVRDTVAGLVGASRLGKQSWVETCASLLTEQKSRLYVIALLEDPALRRAEPLKKRLDWQDERSSRLKQRLSWLTPYVTVASPFDERLPDMAAQNLPGAGQR